MSIKASLKLEIEDTPGQLRNLLGIFEQVNANIISIVHKRAEKSSLMVPVEIVFSVPEKKVLESIGILLKQAGRTVFSLNKVARIQRVSIGIVGHIIKTGSVETLIKKIDSNGANVFKFTASMPGENHESSAIISFEAENSEIIAKTMKEIKMYCEYSNLLLIREVE